MFCQFHALGSLHSNCQWHKAEGSGRWRMSDVTECSMKKTVYGGYVLGGFQIRGGGGMLLVGLTYYFTYSLLRCKCSCIHSNKAPLSIMQCMKFLRRLHMVPAYTWGTDKKQNSLQSMSLKRKATALRSSTTLLFFHIWLHNLTQIKVTLV